MSSKFRNISYQLRNKPFKRTFMHPGAVTLTYLNYTVKLTRCECNYQDAKLCLEPYNIFRIFKGSYKFLSNKLMSSFEGLHK